MSGSLWDSVSFSLLMNCETMIAQLTKKKNIPFSADSPSGVFSPLLRDSLMGVTCSCAEGESLARNLFSFFFLIIYNSDFTCPRFLGDNSSLEPTHFV